MTEKLQITLTEDGSPTAAFSNYEGEKMHHSGGAFGESVYIFGPAIQWGFSKTETPHIVSLGTGLAYNEILSTAFSLVFEQDFVLCSFEKDEHLNESLKKWIQGVPSELEQVYDLILKKTAEVFEISELEIKKKMLQCYVNGNWKIYGAFPEDLKIDHKFHVVCYDFFSSKAMEHFWTQSYLESFLKNLTDTKCAFATYACTGNLKRAFKTTGFNFVERKGYLWKRSSTFAFRNN